MYVLIQFSLNFSQRALRLSIFFLKIRKLIFFLKKIPQIALRLSIFFLEIRKLLFFFSKITSVFFISEFAFIDSFPSVCWLSFVNVIGTFFVSCTATSCLCCYLKMFKVFQNEAWVDLMKDLWST